MFFKKENSDPFSIPGKSKSAAAEKKPFFKSWRGKLLIVGAVAVFSAASYAHFSGRKTLHDSYEWQMRQIDSTYSAQNLPAGDDRGFFGKLLMEDSRSFELAYLMKRYHLNAGQMARITRIYLAVKDAPAHQEYFKKERPSELLVLRTLNFYRDLLSKPESLNNTAQLIENSIPNSKSRKNYSEADESRKMCAVSILRIASGLPQEFRDSLRTSFSSLPKKQDLK